MSDPTKLSETGLGKAIKFMSAPRRTAIPPSPNPVAQAVAPRKSQGIAVVTDHPATATICGIAGVLTIAFAVRPDVVGVVLSAPYRLGIGIAGFLLIPVLPAALSRGIQSVAGGVGVLIELWQKFKGTKKDG